MKLALLTCQSLGEYNNNVESEDELLARYLRGKGMTVEFAVWDNPAVDWEAYQAVVVKSPWDYFNKVAAFYTWLQDMEHRQVRLFNPAAVIRWNADKIYLKEIAEAGLPIVPTQWLEPGQPVALAEYFTHFGVDKIIVKPRVSGGSKNTFAIGREEVAPYTAQIQALVAAEGFMVQPFLKEVPQAGEYSFLFFGGQFSHCVLKKAKAGDFRVQHYLGGSIEEVVPPAHLLAQAERVVAQFAPGCLYARVDGIAVGPELWLMELELIEPFLFLFTEPSSFGAYYEALQTLLLEGQVKA